MWFVLRLVVSPQTKSCTVSSLKTPEVAWRIPPKTDFKLHQSITKTLSCCQQKCYRNYSHRTDFNRYMIIQAFHRIKANSYIHIAQIYHKIHQCLEEKVVQNGLNYRSLGWESVHAGPSVATYPCSVHFLGKQFKAEININRDYSFPHLHLRRGLGQSLRLPLLSVTAYLQHQQI